MQRGVQGYFRDPRCKGFIIRQFTSLFWPLTFALVMEIDVTKQTATKTEKCIFLAGEGRNISNSANIFTVLELYL